MSNETKRILQQIRDLVSSVSKRNQKELLEELDAEHEGWNMLLKEMEGEEEEECE